MDCNEQTEKKNSEEELGVNGRIAANVKLFN